MSVFKQRIIQTIIENATDEPGELHFFSPLLNFFSEIQEIKLSENVVICKPSPDELKVIKQDTLLMDFVHDWSFVVRSVMPFNGSSSFDNRADSQSEPYNCCRALRLLKKGTIGLGPQYMAYNPPYTCLSRMGKSRNPIYIDTYEQYLFSENELKKLLSIYNAIKNIDRQKLSWLNNAILRFESSYEIGFMDSPIDLMIGLEALYISDDKELSYKLAMRSSCLLGQTKEQRNKIFSTIMTAYGVRSKLVHGNELKDDIRLKSGEHISLFELNSLIREILRKSILRFLELAKSYSNKDLSNKILDENILSNGALLRKTDDTTSNLN